MDRRKFLAYFSTTSLAGTLFPGVLWAHAAAAEDFVVNEKTIEAAEKIAGLEFTDAERKDMARGLKRIADRFEAVRAVPLPGDIPPAFRFDPLLPGMSLPDVPAKLRFSRTPLPPVPSDIEEMAFWSALDLGRAIHTGKISSTDVTRMYLNRLKRYDPVLHCVITLTEERALEQARRADADIASGTVRSPLHGVPWGAKDLLAAKGYPTTWGAKPYADRVIDTDATVVRRLDEAGAVLVAKLSLGALAQGDLWFGGRTRNPWYPKGGSSGSSAGPASATAAGLVGFSIGSETNGSIASPATVCGVTGLRPTFGHISRHGVMPLSWTMDKLGPLCRTVEDCVAVLDVVRGPDDRDPTVVDAPIGYDAQRDISELKVGYVRDAFTHKAGSEKTHEERTLDELRTLGVDLLPINLPDLPYNDMGFILTVEAAASFDEFTRSNRDDELVNQARFAWPNTLRQARFVPAVEYIQANRVRTLLMRHMAELMERVDAYVAPSRQDLSLTNFTGHPMITLPNGFTKNGLPTGIGFVGRLYGEGALCALANAYQHATGYHRKHPEMEA